MKEKLRTIYQFLASNRQYNKELQEKEYRKMVCQHECNKDRAVSLLYGIANSQSQPKIDFLANFFRQVMVGYDRLSSFEGFLEVVTGNTCHRYLDLFEGLRKRKGWGDKTAALLSKVVFNLHSGKYASELLLWKDAPSGLEEDRIHLPVDAVIVEVFRSLGLRKPTFKSINFELFKHFGGEEIVVLDDLWFWGFITQRSVSGKRIHEWNPNKYWALEFSDKNPDVIKDVERKSKEFLSLIDQ